MITTAEIAGKRALIEVRFFRRTHRLVIATLQKEEESLYAVFEGRNHSGPFRIKIDQEKLALFDAVQRADYDFRYRAVLYLNDDQSEDTPLCAKPPTIVSHEDIAKQKSA